MRWRRRGYGGWKKAGLDMWNASRQAESGSVWEERRQRNQEEGSGGGGGAAGRAGGRVAQQRGRGGGGHFT